MLKNGELIELDVSGIRKAGNETKAEVSDAFHLGSCSKAMTSTLAAILIDDGKLTWTSTIESLLPELNIHPLYRSMTFETLLVHRGGFPVEEPTLFSEVSFMTPVLGRNHIAKTLLEREPLSNPDSAYKYSNFNYIIAGHILERLSQKSWEELIQTKIFQPLQMKTCGFGLTSREQDVFPGSIWAHVLKNGEMVPRHFDNPLSFGPSSSVHCSLEDWSKFLRMIVQGYRNESSFLKADSFRKLFSTHPAGDSTYTYGGWSLLQRSWADGPVLTHNGSNLMNYAVAWIAPNKNSVLFSTTNIGGEDAFLATDSAIRLLISKNLP